MPNIWRYQRLKGLAEMQESALWLRVCLDDLDKATSGFVSVFGETPLPEQSARQLQFVITQVHELKESISKLTIDIGRHLFNNPSDDTLLSWQLRMEVQGVVSGEFTRRETVNAIDRLLVVFRETRNLILLAGSIACDVFELYSPPGEEESSVDVPVSGSEEDEDTD